MSDIISVSSGSDSGTTRVILKSVKFNILSYLISLVLLAVFAALIVYTDIPENISGIVVNAVTLFGAFLSALLTMRSLCSKGWLFGFLTGVFNIALLFIIGSLFIPGNGFTLQKILFILYGGLCGAAGGIIGVNLGKN